MFPGRGFEDEPDDFPELEQDEDYRPLDFDRDRSSRDEEPTLETQIEDFLDILEEGDSETVSLDDISEEELAAQPEYEDG